MERINPWTIWLGKHWKVIEPRLYRELQKAFKQERYTGEFEDVIQSFVVSLMTNSRLEDFLGDTEQQRQESLTYSLTPKRLSGLSFWCVRKMIAQHNMDSRHGTVLPQEFADDPFHWASSDPTPEECLEPVLEPDEQLAEFDALIRKHFGDRQPRIVWDLLRSGVSRLEIAKEIQTTPQNVSRCLTQIRVYLTTLGYSIAPIPKRMKRATA